MSTNREVETFLCMIFTYVPNIDMHQVYIKQQEQATAIEGLQSEIRELQIKQGNLTTTRLTTTYEMLWFVWRIIRFEFQILASSI